MDSSSGPISKLLQRANLERPEARAELFELVYQELRRLAERALRQERPDHTLAPTGLIHEAYLKLFAKHGLEATSRPYFFAAPRLGRVNGHGLQPVRIGS